MKVLLICIIFVYVFSVQMNDSLTQQQRNLELRNAKEKLNQNYLRNQGRNQNYQMNQNQNMNQNQLDSGNSNMNNLDNLQNRNDLLNQNLYEIINASDNTRLVANRRKGSRDKGRIKLNENKFRNRGTNNNNLVETFKNTKNQNQGSTLLNSNLNFNGYQSNNRLNRNNALDLLNSEKQRYGLGLSNGLLNSFSNTDQSGQGTKRGRSVSTYDNTGQGKSLDHIYNNKKWDNMNIIYDRNKQYQELKLKNKAARNNDNKRNRSLDKHLKQDHAASSSRNNSGSIKNHNNSYDTTKQKRQYQKDSSLIKRNQKNMKLLSKAK